MLGEGDFRLEPDDLRVCARLNRPKCRPKELRNLPPKKAPGRLGGRGLRSPSLHVEGKTPNAAATALSQLCLRYT